MTKDVTCLKIVVVAVRGALQVVLHYVELDGHAVIHLKECEKISYVYYSVYM